MVKAFDHDYLIVTTVVTILRADISCYAMPCTGVVSISRAEDERQKVFSITSLAVHVMVHVIVACDLPDHLGESHLF